MMRSAELTRGRWYFRVLINTELHNLERNRGNV